MAQSSGSDLWKQAYRYQYGTDPDQDMAQNAEDVEQWRTNWQGGYDAGEAWARDLLNPPTASTATTAPAASPMRTFADFERQNPNIRGSTTRGAPSVRSGVRTPPTGTRSVPI